ncbi:hypothetical protein RUM44_009056 [Polyplax serrata]|uniref:Uncharacterized protein n=1 Tax=Polyplax serrata TaxID=468196 RepID=A0ABR1ATB1_POLSC
MIPEEETGESAPVMDDIMLAGYQECANEALTWLLNLGYEPGHPIICSLAAHLTKKQAYLEKLNLERFLIQETLKTIGKTLRDEDAIEDDDNFELVDAAYEFYAQQIQNNKEVQKALVDAVYKGCDLQYSENLPKNK